MGGRITRRALLAGALATAACGRIPGFARGRAAHAPVCRYPFVVPLQSDTDLQAFAEFAPGILPVTLNKAMAAGAPFPHWMVWSATPFYPPRWYAPLDSTFRQANLDTSVLLAGTLKAFQDEGASYALPTGITPVGVSYRPDAFAAARIREPTSGWTLADFEASCADIASAVEAGKIPNCYGPLPPMVGASSVDSLFVYGDLYYVWTWFGFVAGHGVTLVKNGHYDLTSPEAIAAFSKVAQIARDYGAPQKYLPQTRNEYANSTYRQGAAMIVGPYDPRNAWSADPKRRWLRFPHMPVRPVVPASLVGVRLSFNASHGGFQDGPFLANAPEWAVEGIVRFCVWQYNVQHSTPAASPLPPVLQDPNVQDSYWRSRTQGATEVGDWRNYIIDQQGWPATGTDGGFQVQTFFKVFSVAVQGQEIATLLAQAERDLNSAAEKWAQDLSEARRLSTGAAPQPPDTQSPVCARA